MRNEQVPKKKDIVVVSFRTKKVGWKGYSCLGLPKSKMKIGPMRRSNNNNAVKTKERMTLLHHVVFGSGGSVGLDGCR